MNYFRFFRKAPALLIASGLSVGTAGFLLNNVEAQQELTPSPVLEAPAGSAAAATGALPAAAPIVKDIEIRYIGPRTVDPERIKANMVTKVGDEYSQAATEQDVKNLYQAGVIENIAIRSQPQGNGVKLILEVNTRAAVGEVVFIGNTRLKEDDLRKETEVKVGELISDQKLQAGREKILAAYRKKGYTDVEVGYDLAPLTRAGFSRVTFNIAEGGQSFVHQIYFEGVSAVKEGRLREVLKTKRKNIFSFLTDSGRIDNAALQEDIKKVEKRLGDEGHLNARVVNVQRVRYNDKSVDLVFQVVEGPKFTVNQVKIAGTAVSTVDAPPNLSQGQNGATYSASAVEADETRLRSYFGARGYADVRVSTVTEAAGPNVVNVIYQVDQGTKTNIRRINIEGNTKTKDIVLRRELAVAPGDEFNTPKLDASKKRLENLGYFSNVDFRYNDTVDPNFKDIDITVAETSTGSINFGGGFSSIDSLVGFFEVSQSNFDIFNWPSLTGDGQKFRLGIKYGNKRRDFNLSFVEPWFLEQRLALGFDLFYRDLFYLSDYYDQRNIGGSVSLRRALGDKTYIRGEYKLQNIQISGITEDASPEIASEEGDYLQSMLSLEIVNDTRNDFKLPRKGHKLSFGTSVSGSFLGGDVDDYGFSFSGAQHFLLPGDTILTFEGAVNVVNALSGEVPIFDRLFLGGANNLRGFKYRDVGPKDENEEALGGKTSAFVTVEYTFPIYSDKVRGAVFGDAGIVNADSYDFGLGNVYSDVGVGLRLFLPIGPVNLDFGYPIQKDEFNDGAGKFNFTIGFQY